MKIFNAAQQKHIDKKTIEKEPISSIDLMERAAMECVTWMSRRSIEDKEIHIFCGMGNNGGDGLAIARMLYNEDYMTSTNVVHFSDKMSDDFVTNYKRAEEAGIYPIGIHSEEDFPQISEDDIVIDAIFGIGLNKKPQGFTKKLIQYINNSGATVYSIDVPSGLFIDKTVSDKKSVILAEEVMTFQAPKLAFLLPENSTYIESFVILDIGLDNEMIENMPTEYHLTMNADIQAFYKERKKFVHKGSFGHSLLIGGSFGKIGAAVLASKAALKVGSGLVTAYIPRCGYTIMQTAIPEVMVEVDAENEIEFINIKTKPTVIGMGIGMGTSDKTAKALGEFLSKNKLPLVLDADALNIISKNSDYLALLPKDTILTPHPKELERLIGEWSDDYDKLKKASAFSIKHDCIILIKGAYTVVIDEEQHYFNSTGNPALATAGTGDVLTGMITGLIAQQYTPLQAAILGVFLHGRTAEFSQMIMGSIESFIASDSFKFIADAYSSIYDFPEDAFIAPPREERDLDDFLDNLYFDDEDEDPPF